MAADTGVGRARERPLAGEGSDDAACPRTASSSWARVGAIPGADRVQLGQVLLHAKLLTPRQLDEALARQFRWGSRLGDVVLASGWVKPLDFYRALAEHFHLPFVNLVEHPADRALFQPGRYADYARDLYLPWRREAGVLWIATADPTSAKMLADWGKRPDVRFVMTSKFDVIWELQRVAGTAFTKDAVSHLSSFDPERSARVVLTKPQKQVFLAMALGLLASLILLPLKTAILFNAGLNLFLFVSFVFRTVLCWMSCAEHIGLVVDAREVAALADRDLPLYSILVPMYKEPAVLPILTAALKRMDYPKSKLDIKLVLEEGDTETIEAAKALALDATFEIVRVPRSEPKTKPKACNYALRLCRGQFVTIYDAEDKPEPDQLKKVVAAFRKLGEGTACIQARLNYFNAEENWLTRMFTLEYSLWFDMFLPALDRLRVPIPLGGTSNHFDLEKLRRVGAWDPFNVTEDADLGLRFAGKGYRVGVVNSLTYEEANTQIGNWIRQRSRWIKGYMQTWLVNMRHPVELLRTVGWSGFLSFQLFIGGTILSGMVYPFLVIPFAVWLVTRTAALHALFPPEVLLFSMANLLIGNSCLIYLSMLAVAKRKHHALLPYALTVPGYWLLQSVAAYKALWQLVRNPFYWEKTAHGISRYTSAEVAEAASSQA
jgi:cellulose synthase/poly-beta-1,6-N-acetylglucosamine synthase-like glycosyltransferase